MESHGNWYERTVKEISLHKDSLSKKDAQKYKLDLLLRIARRLDDFSSYCGECQLFQPEITRISQALAYMVQLPKQTSKEERKSYFETINTIIKHLQKQHKLVTEGRNMGIWIGIGMGIGTAIGAALDNPGFGTAIGIGIGVAIGRYMDAKAKQEGKVI